MSEDVQKPGEQHRVSNVGQQCLRTFADTECFPCPPVFVRVEDLSACNTKGDLGIVAVQLLECAQTSASVPRASLVGADER